MTTHTLPLTYKPKIEPVRKGLIRQTIRLHWKVKANDRILFHGWSGKPYYSKWDWRMYVTVFYVENIFIFKEGIMYAPPNLPVLQPWEHLDVLAEYDGIVPPTGIELGNVLNKYHKLRSQEETLSNLYEPYQSDPDCQFQIIRW